MCEDFDPLFTMKLEIHCLNIFLSRPVDTICFVDEFPVVRVQISLPYTVELVKNEVLLYIDLKRLGMGH